MGLLITLEGIDGAGKSTQVQRLLERLQSEGYDVVFAREPGGTPLGEAVRSVLLQTGLDMNVITEALLFAAARAELVQQVVYPSLQAGRIVVLDRYVDSSAAYQAYGGGLPADFVSQVNVMATGGVRPHRTIVLDVPPEVGMERSRSKRTDRFQAQAREYQERVRAGYLELAQAEPRRMKVVNANRDPDAVASDVWALVEEILPPPPHPEAG